MCPYELDSYTECQLDVFCLTDGVLTDEHLPQLMTVLGTAAHYSWQLGIQLGLDVHEVRTFEEEAGRNLARFMTSILSTWLQRRDSPTLQELVDTISDPPLKDEDLAYRVKQKFA